MKRKTFILLLVSISLMISLAGVLSFGFISLLRIKDEGSILKGELDSWLKKSKDSTVVEDALAESKSVRSEMDKYIFLATEENQISFISEIENIIQRTGSDGEVRSLDITPDYSKLICSVTFSGKWNNIYNTLLALEAYPIKVNLDDVSVIEEKSVDINQSSDKDLAKEQQYRANVKFTITNISKPK